MAEPTPHALLDAFERYERALMADDVAELDALFAPGPDTVRGDAQGVLVGHDAIAAFRRGRGGAPQRRLGEVRVRMLAEDAAVVVAETLPATGGRGLQTQVWRRTSAGWQVVSAHVAAPAPAVDGRIWRLVGTPLVEGAADGPLARKRVAVKDLFAVAGQRIGAGVPAYLRDAPTERETAPAVQALLAAGADVTGIARTDEFAYSIAGANPHYGTPPNGAVVGGLPGGSSSGPASAVALGQADIGLATDTAGSIRVPASYQGLWGIRTTHGAVPVKGLLPLAPSFDTVGWLTRDATLLAATARSSLPDRDAPVASRSLVIAPALLAALEPAVADAFLAAVRAAVRSGAIDEPEEVDLGDAAAAFAAFRTQQAAEAWAEDGDWLGAHPDAVSGAVAARFAIAAAIGSEEADAARASVAAERDRLRDLLAEHTIVLPSAASVAPQTTASEGEIDRVRALTLQLTCFAGIAGAPAVSAPLAAVGRAPLGVCFIGAPGSDLDLIELAASAVPQH